MSETKSFTQKTAEYINFLTLNSFTVDVWLDTDIICLLNHARTLVMFPIDFNIEPFFKNQNGEPFSFDGNLLKDALKIFETLKETSFDVVRKQGYPLILKGNYFQIIIAPLTSDMDDTETNEGMN